MYLFVLVSSLILFVLGYVYQIKPTTLTRSALQYTLILVSYHIRIPKPEIRSMERGICPIAVFYFALKRSIFNILKRYLSTKVPMLPDFGSHDDIGYMTIRLAVGGFL